jgi:hypothetical protein
MNSQSGGYKLRPKDAVWGGGKTRGTQIRKSRKKRSKNKDKKGKRNLSRNWGKDPN